MNELLIRVFLGEFSIFQLFKVVKQLGMIKLWYREKRWTENSMINIVPLNKALVINIVPTERCIIRFRH